MQYNTLVVQYKTGGEHKEWYIQIFLVKMVVRLLITQTQKLMIASSSLDKDTWDQTDKLSTWPLTLSWTYHH